MHSAPRRHLTWIVVVAIALLSGACGSDNNTAGGPAASSGVAAKGAKDHAALSGAGSTFVQTMLQEWIKGYQRVAPGVTINYASLGSGIGIQQLISKTVDFAGSDVALKPEELSAAGGAGSVLEIPWIAGAIAVEYNLPGVKDLKLSPETLASIFAGKITKWNDPAVVAENPGASLPPTGIQVVHRSDGSGTTSVFTSFLTAAAPKVWTYGSGKDVPWPAGTGAQHSDGVTAAVKQSPGAIGYAEISFPKQASLGIAQIGNGAGAFTSPTASSVKAAIATATVNPDLTLKLNYTPTDPAAYPISTTTYLVFAKAQNDPAKGAALRHFADWALTDGQKLAESVDYAPMPQSIVTQAMTLLGNG